MENKKLMMVEVEYEGRTYRGSVEVEIDENGIWWDKELEIWSNDSWYLRMDKVLDYDVSLDGDFAINFEDGTRAEGFAKFVDIE